MAVNFKSLLKDKKTNGGWRRILMSQMTTGSVCRNHNPVLSSFMNHHQIFNKSNMTDVTSGVGAAYHS
jgi:hypothetical protein